VPSTKDHLGIQDARSADLRLVGQDADSVETKGIEGICDFPQRPIDIGQWQKSECAEPVRVRRDQRAGALVGRPGPFTDGVAIDKAECGEETDRTAAPIPFWSIAARPESTVY
jgi:hypothetical protein